MHKKRGPYQDVKVRRKAEKRESSGKEKKPDFWNQFTGQRLVLVTRNKRIYEENFVNIQQGFICLQDVVIQGNVYKARPEYVFLDRNQVVHIHSAVVPVTEVSPEE